MPSSRQAAHSAEMVDSSNYGGNGTLPKHCEILTSFKLAYAMKGMRVLA